LIHFFTYRAYSSFLLACLILFGFQFIIGDFSTVSLSKLLVLLLEGVLLDYFCFKFGILNQKSHLPLVLFAVLSVLIMPELSLGDLIYGAVCLSAFFLAFESGNNPDQATTLLVVFGVLLGVAQAISNISVFLMLPFFVLFLQTGTRDMRSFILSALYFFMVVLSYLGLLFVMELTPQIHSLVPSLSLDYNVFNTILIKLFLPFLVMCIVVHFYKINNYPFRHPNKSKIVNYTMFLQACIALILILLTAEMNLMIYALMCCTILLSFGFTYNKTSVFVNAAFVSLITIAFMALYLYRILIL
jgi:hypothetical protein